MPEPEKPVLEERVARLERLVEALIHRGRTEQRGPEASAPSRPVGVESGAGEGSQETGQRPSQRPGQGPSQRPSQAPSHAPRPDSVAARPPSSAEQIRSPSLAGQSERWLGRIGIGFVVLAMALLLKLSFDRGWITPALRLVAGLGAGSVLLFFGLRLEEARKRLAQALLGGSIAIFYLVGFAGLQLYELLPFWVALLVMTATTVLSIVLSVRQDSPLLGVFGVVGGLATPFLLESGSDNVSALAVYVSVVLLGGGAVQLYRGWVSLLGTLLVGGTIVLALVVFAADGAPVVVPTLAIAVFWLVAAASPLLRPVVASLPQPDRPLQSALWGSRAAVTWATLATVVLLSVHLSFEVREVGLLLFLFGLMTGTAAYRTRGVSLAQWPSAELSALCVAFGLWFVADDPAAILLVVAETLVLFTLVARGAPSSLRIIGHVLAGVVAWAFLYYAANAPLDGFLGLREDAFVRLAVLGIFVGCSMSVEKDHAPVYKAAAYIGLLAWVLSEFGPKPYGAQLVSIAWSVQGAITLVASVRKRSQPLQLVGLATLGLVAGKLLLFDLSQLEPVWRILMFLGFGAGLLGLAYLVNRPPDSEQSVQREPREESSP